MLENDIAAITKIYTMTVGSKSWREDIQYKTKNTASVFRTEGLWTFYFTGM